MKTRRIGPFEVGAIGLGCMNLSHAYGAPPPKDAAAALLRRALELGVTLFDTAALYGFGANETLVGEVLGPHRRRIALASKCGLHGRDDGQGVKRVLDGRPETIRWSCEQSLQRLRTDVIDLFYLHRLDRNVPIEDSVGALADLVKQGKVRTIGLSEMSAATIRRAHAVHPVTAVQTEYSLWTRNPEIAVLETCREIGAAFVAFSPVARGFLSDAPPRPEAFEAKDIRRTMPRFDAEHWPRNLALLAPLQEVARSAGCSVAQLALAWLLHKAPHVVPIPGTTSIAHLDENVGAAAVSLTAAQMARLDEVVNERTVAGPRYNAATQSEIDTEQFR